MSIKVLAGLVLGALGLAVWLPSASVEAQTSESPTAKRPAVVKKSAAKTKVNKVAIQVSENDKNVMNRALNNTRNLIAFYKAKGEKVNVEIVTFHDGLHLLRSESPVKDRIAVMALENPEVTFVACANTQANQSKAEGKAVTLLSEAKVMPSGIARLIELQQQGYTYIRP